MAKTAKPTPISGTTAGAVRPGGDFFARPTGPQHRRYEALRGYLFEGLTYEAAADRSGYSTATLRSAVRDFRSGKTGFFLNPRPGPTRAPAKNAAREKILALRRAGHSAKEISQLLADTATPLNRTGVAQVINEAGLGRLGVRAPGTHGGPPFRDHPPRAHIPDFDQLPARAATKAAGLLLTLPDLIALDLPGIVAAAGYPGTSAIGALNYVLSLLALKLTGTRRVSHVDDLAADTGGDLDLDFHAIMHWGDDVALEKHYVPKRSQRTRSVLSFFAQDGASQTLVYANADLTKATQSAEVLVFADHWKTLTGTYPQRLVMDQKVTTHQMLAELDARGITFLTLRMRSPALNRHVDSLPATAWHTVRLDRDGKYQRPRVVDETATISGYPNPVRQLVITGLGRDAATVMITNDTANTPKHVIERYARRMNIEQRLAESIQSFHTDALAGSVPLNIDLDVALTVLAGAVCAALRRRLTGYHQATPDTLQRRFLSTPGTIENDGNTITVHLRRRTYSPVLRAAAIPDTTIPWWGNRTLHFEYD